MYNKSFEPTARLRLAAAERWDFGIDDLPTYVFSGIGLTGSNGTTSYSSFHYADGEGVFYEEWGRALVPTR